MSTQSNAQWRLEYHIIFFLKIEKKKIHIYDYMIHIHCIYPCSLPKSCCRIKDGPIITSADYKVIFLWLHSVGTITNIPKKYTTGFWLIYSSTQSSNYTMVYNECKVVP